jgi:predicted DNA-binding protein with PD1-like motif
MRSLAIRLRPHQELRSALQALLAEHGVGAAFVLQGIGSLDGAWIRFAGMDEATEVRGDLEILTLSGSLAPDGVHLHISVADSAGRVVGGHVAPGCIVRTTAEVLVALLPDAAFSREPDEESGCSELVIRAAAPPAER